jgi:hypothetical protein
MVSILQEFFLFWDQHIEADQFWPSVSAGRVFRKVEIKNSSSSSTANTIYMVILGYTERPNVSCNKDFFNNNIVDDTKADKSSAMHIDIKVEIGTFCSSSGSNGSL